MESSRDETLAPRCAHCGTGLVRRHTGRRARWCSRACQQAAYRARQAAMTEEAGKAMAAGLQAARSELVTLRAALDEARRGAQAGLPAGGTAAAGRQATASSRDGTRPAARRPGRTAADLPDWPIPPPDAQPRLDRDDEHRDPPLPPRPRWRVSAAGIPVGQVRQVLTGSGRQARYEPVLPHGRPVTPGGHVPGDLAEAAATLLSYYRRHAAELHTRARPARFLKPRADGRRTVKPGPWTIGEIIPPGDPYVSPPRAGRGYAARLEAGGYLHDGGDHAHTRVFTTEAQARDVLREAWLENNPPVRA